MMTQLEESVGKRRLLIFGGILAAFAIAVVLGALFHHRPDNVLVIGARRDCLRAFAEDTCRELMNAAFKVHAKVAPQFPDRGLCEMTFGPGGCLVIGDPKFFRSYVPKMTVVLLTKDSDEKGVVPLYFGPEGADDGVRRVYYRGDVVGRFSEIRFGGAKLSRVVDLDGAPMSVAAVEKFRGR